MILFSTQAYAAMAARMCADADLEPGEVERRSFEDGERYLRLTTPVDGHDVAIVGGTIDDESTLELYDLSSALVQNGAESVTVVIPYFGYSTMERAVNPGEVVTAKTRARLLSSIPTAANGNRVVLLDLHSEGIPHYFEASLRPFHLYAKKIVLAACQELGGKDFVLACTDAGRAKWVESLANDIGAQAAFVLKRRTDAGPEVTALSARVEGRTVVVYDDMIRTGATLIAAAKAYKDAGAAKIFAVATHGLFSANALDDLRNCGLIEQIVVTDSHPRAEVLADDSFLKVHSVAQLLVGALKGRGRKVTP